MNYNQYEIRTRVWIYPGDAAWHFVSVPRDVSDDIRKQFDQFRRGWGSLPVRVTVGATTWKTSIFPDKKTGTYLLPIKAEIRKNERIKADDRINLSLEIQV